MFSLHKYSEDGCDNTEDGDNLCEIHNEPRCVEPGCNNIPRKNQRKCPLHGGCKVCIELGCNNNANPKTHKCKVHSRIICNIPGCDKTTKKGYSIKRIVVSTETDVTGNGRLEGLLTTPSPYYDNKDLIEIDFTNGDLPEYGVNKGFKSIDVSNNTKLIRFWFGRNRFTELDVSMCPNLTDVWIHDNPQLTSFRYTPTSKLIMFAAWNTGLESIDLKGAYPLAIHAYDNKKLKTIKVISLQWLNNAIARNSVAYTKDLYTQWIE